MQYFETKHENQLASCSRTTQPQLGDLINDNQYLCTQPTYVRKVSAIF